MDWQRNTTRNAHKRPVHRTTYTVQYGTVLYEHNAHPQHKRPVRTRTSTITSTPRYFLIRHVRDCLKHYTRFYHG